MCLIFNMCWMSPWQVKERLEKMGPFQPMNIFLRQEIDRMQKVLALVRSTLTELKLAIDGTIIMSENLRDALNCMFDARIPARWKKVRLHLLWFCLIGVLLWIVVIGKWKTSKDNLLKHVLLLRYRSPCSPIFLDCRQGRKWCSLSHIAGALVDTLHALFHLKLAFYCSHFTDEELEVGRG